MLNILSPPTLVLYDDVPDFVHELQLLLLETPFVGPHFQIEAFSRYDELANYLTAEVDSPEPPVMLFVDYILSDDPTIPPGWTGLEIARFARELYPDLTCYLYSGMSPEYIYRQTRVLQTPISDFFSKSDPLFLHHLQDRLLRFSQWLNAYRSLQYGFPW
jgi:hypothetical protein